MIPKIIHYCWFGNGKMSEADERCIDSWKKFCPDYKIIQWNEDNYDVRQNQYMSQAYDSKKWGFVPDYARLDIIYKYGGIYFDTDVELIRNIDKLLENSAFMGFEDDKHVNLGQGFGAEKGNEVIGRIRDRGYSNRRFIKDNGEIDTTPSPIINTDTLIQMGLKQSNVIQKIDSLTVYPKDYLCPISFENNQFKPTENTYSIHHFHASWLEPEEKEYRLIYIYINEKLNHKLASIVLWIVNKMYRFKMYVRKKGLLNAIVFLLKRKRN